MSRGVIGTNIRRWRKFREMSQQDLADLAGYATKSSINKIETGLVDVPLPRLKKIASVLRVNVNKLMSPNSEPDSEAFEPGVPVAVLDDSSELCREEIVNNFRRAFSENPSLAADAQKAYASFITALYTTLNNLPLTTNAEEVELLSFFRRLTGENKKAVLALAKVLSLQTSDD